jgi:hypothetical protein
MVPGAEPRLSDGVREDVVHRPQRRYGNRRIEAPHSAADRLADSSGVESRAHDHCHRWPGHLSVWDVHLRVGRLLQPEMTDVADDPHDIARRGLTGNDGELVRDPLSDRILVWPESASHRLVDDHHTRRTRAVALVEQSAAPQGYVDGRKKAGRNHMKRRGWTLRARQWRLTSYCERALVDEKAGPRIQRQSERGPGIVHPGNRTDLGEQLIEECRARGG